MNVAVIRVLAVAALALPLTAAAQAAPNSPRGGDTRDHIPPHTRENLWPTRPLTPVEEALKQHILVLGDSIRAVEATHDQAARQQRAGSSVAVFRSTGRTLSGQCARAGRTVDPVIEFAGTLSTSDQRWGDRAVTRWRAALGELKSELGRCQSGATEELANSGDATPRKITAIAASARKVIADYRRAESDLINTLQIKVDPRDRI